MNKNRIRLTESQLHNLIKKSVKSFINEGGHLTWKDDDGRMHTNSQDNWYGIEGATFVSHGEWSDGEIYFDYEGEQYVINANDAEEWLWNDFKDYCEENNLNPDEHSDDEIWYNFARNEGYDVLLNLGPYNESYEMNESKKRKVRLTESDLHNIINESVNKILKEDEFLDSFITNKMLQKSSPHTQKMVAMFGKLRDVLGEIGKYANEQGIYNYCTPDRKHRTGAQYSDIKKMIEQMLDYADILENTWGQHLYRVDKNYKSRPEFQLPSKH